MARWRGGAVAQHKIKKIFYHETNLFNFSSSDRSVEKLKVENEDTNFPERRSEKWLPCLTFLWVGPWLAKTRRKIRDPAGPPAGCNIINLFFVLF